MAGVPDFPTGPLYLISSSDELLIIISGSLPTFFSPRSPPVSWLSRCDTIVRQKEKRLSLCLLARVGHAADYVAL